VKNLDRVFKTTAALIQKSYSASSKTIIVANQVYDNLWRARELRLTDRSVDIVRADIEEGF
jgi:hypothetical protein